MKRATRAKKSGNNECINDDNTVDNMYDAIGSDDHEKKNVCYSEHVKDVLRFVVSSPILYWNSCIKSVSSLQIEGHP